jgi:hypothetical protein
MITGIDTLSAIHPAKRSHVGFVVDEAVCYEIAPRFTQTALSG